MVKRGLILGGVLALFGGASVFAEGAEISIDVSNASLQLTVQSSVNIVLNPSTSSSFGDVVVPFSVATNNPTGYRVLMSVPQTEMLHNTIVSANIPTLTETTTEANFPVNKWGYKTTGDYNPIKLTNEDPSWTYDGPTNSNSHNLTLAAKIDNATPAGTYTNTLTFQVVTNPNAPKDTIVFNANNANATGTMTNQVVFRGEPTTLNTNNYTLEGYSFMGWNTMADGTGEGYGDGDLYTDYLAFSAATTSITLYAQWQEGGSGGYAGRTLQAAFEQAYVNNPGQFPKDEGGYKHGLYVPEKDPETGEYTGIYHEATQQSEYEGIPANDLRFAIQDIDMLVGNENVCERTTVVGSSAHVLDLRDYQSYWIAKLPDGRCWMLDNLAIGGTTSKLLTSEYTNIASDFELPASSSSTFSAYTYSMINMTYKDTSYLDPSVARDSWKTGGFYNYCAVSGGTYCYGERSNYDAPGTTIDSQYDICPRGWRLPTGYANEDESYSDRTGEFTNLADKYSSYNNFVNSFHFVLAGAYHRTLDYPNARAYYWTASKAKTGTNENVPQSMIYLSGNNGTITNTTYNRYFGFSVRCIAK